MMDNTELIWKYIDGSCNPEELDLFNSRMSDEDFAADYQQALDLHGALSTGYATDGTCRSNTTDDAQSGS